MTALTDSPERGRRRREPEPRAPKRRKRVVGFGLLGVVALLVAAAGWLAWSGLAAKDRLESAEAGTDVLRAAVLDTGERGSSVDKAATLAAVRSDSERARELTSGPVWRAAGVLPWVGESVRAVTTTTASVDDVAQQVLPVLVEQAEVLAPETLRVDGDRIDVDRIAAAAPAISEASRAAERASAQVADIDTARLPASLATAIGTAQDGLAELARTTTDASEAARLIPPMLGAEGKRRYFLGFQTNAELRGSGGLLGAYGVLVADRGRLRIARLGPRSELDDGDLRRPALDLGAEFTGLYGDDAALWVNANVSPHFPHSAQLWMAMYERQRGVKLDGAIATDPVALAGLLGATGPVTLVDGTVVTKDNAVDLTMSEVYARLDDDAERDAYLQVIARAVVSKVLSGGGEPRAIADALSASSAGRNLVLYSARAEEQAILAGTQLAGSVAASPGPYVGVFANAGSASKLDYYLDASVDYALGACDTEDRASTVTLRMSSSAPERGLTKYVSGPVGSRGEVSQLDLMTVHLPVGGAVRAATIDGKPLTVTPHTLLGRPVVAFPVLLAAGQDRTVVLELREPVSDLAPRVEVAPLAQPARSSVSGSSCDLGR